MDLKQLEQLMQIVHFERLPVAALIAIGGWILARTTTRTLDNLGERFTERRLLFKQASALSRFTIYFIVTVVLAGFVLELGQQAVLALSGILGVGLGFAFKDLFAALGAGVTLLFDQPFQVGDRVTVGKYYGEILTIGLRSVKLRTLDDNVVTVPNNVFLTDAVANANKGALEAMVVIPFYIAPGEDFMRAKQIISEAATTSRYVFLDKPIITLVTDEWIGFSLVNVIRVKAYVFDVRYEKAFESDVTERVKAALRDAGIRKSDALRLSTPAPTTA